MNKIKRAWRPYAENYLRCQAGSHRVPAQWVNRFRVAIFRNLFIDPAFLYFGSVRDCDCLRRPRGDGIRPDTVMITNT